MPMYVSTIETGLYEWTIRWYFADNQKIMGFGRI